jgi:hypothetical protein
MANTFTETIATLVATLCHEGQRVAQSKLAPLTAYGTLLPIVGEPFRAGLDSEVPLVTAAPATQILGRNDSPNFEADGTVTAPVSCAHKLFLQTVNVENAAYQSGDRIAYAARFAMNQLCNAIVDYVKVNVTTANFGAAVVTKAAATWTQADFSTLAATLDTPQRAIVFDRAYAMRTPTTWLPASGNCAVYECNRWSTAGTNITGFCATPQAFVFRHALPDSTASQRKVVLTSSFELPQLGGLEVEVSTWFALNPRTLCAAYSLYFSATPADTAALTLLCSA